MLFYSDSKALLCQPHTIHNAIHIGVAQSQINTVYKGLSNFDDIVETQLFLRKEYHVTLLLVRKYDHVFPLLVSVKSLI